MTPASGKQELDCAGLDPNGLALAGVIKVKLPEGFNGGLQ